MIRTWYLDLAGGAALPRRMADLARLAKPLDIAPADLPAAAKWEPILRRGLRPTPPGWVPLSELATVRRGIATGCNGFFLLSAAEADRLGIAARHRRPCVGRAGDAPGVIFDRAALAGLRQSGARCELLVFETSALSPAEGRYIAEGAAAGLPARALLKARRPWYGMEPRATAALWWTTFGRHRFRAILNRAQAACLTAFHGIYPDDGRPVFHAALCAVLNSQTVQAGLPAVGRGLGGGLTKIEPRDLAALPLPDLRRLPESDLARLAACLPALHRARLAGEEVGDDPLSAEIDRLAPAFDAAAGRAG